MNVRYPDIHVHITREDQTGYRVDRNFLERVRGALREGGASDEEIAAYTSEATSRCRNHMLFTTMTWVNTSWERDLPDDDPDPMRDVFMEVIRRLTTPGDSLRNSLRWGARPRKAGGPGSPGIVRGVAGGTVGRRRRRKRKRDVARRARRPAYRGDAAERSDPRRRDRQGN